MGEEKVVMYMYQVPEPDMEKIVNILFYRVEDLFQRNAPLPLIENAVELFSHYNNELKLLGGNHWEDELVSFTLQRLQKRKLDEIVIK